MLFGNTFRKIVKLIIKPANIFLVILGCLVIFNSLLSYNNLTQSLPKSNIETNPSNTNLTIRILDKQNTNFGQSKYTVWSQNSLWSMTTAQVFETGKSYQILGQISPITSKNKLNSFDWYYLSLGQQGDIKLKSITKNADCDWICKVIVSQIKFKNNFRLTLQFNSCHNNFIIIQILHLSPNSCSDLAALSYSLILGGTQNFSDGLKSQIKQVGLTHLVAFSGFQVVLIVAFLEKILLSLRLRRSLRIIIIIFSLGITIGIVGLQPPVLRSSLSILISSLTLMIFGVRLAQFRTLVYSAIILLLLNPLYLFNISFQLSFLATLGLILSPKIQLPTWLGFKSFWKIICDTLVETLSAFLMTLPVILTLNSSFSLLSILANLIIVPTIPLLTLLNILTVLPALGNIFGALVIMVEGLILILIRDLSQFSNVFLRYNLSFNIYDIIIFYIVLVIISIKFRK